MESVIAEQLGKKQVLTFRYFQQASRAGALWAGSIGVEDVTRIRWHKTWDCRVFKHTLQIICVGLLQQRENSFTDGQTSLLPLVQSLQFQVSYQQDILSYCEVFFFCYDIRYIQVTQWLSASFFFFFFFWVQFCIEEICCVLYINKDHRSVWYI